ncbi:hypothetical protein BDZ94DRAFT_1122423, partial [Collybia nuda]
VHNYFDALKFWLEPTDLPDTYNYRTPASRGTNRPWIPIITFTISSSKILPVPLPKYLAIQAGCSKVAHLSGAREHIDQVIQEPGNTQVLSQDGTS